MASCEQCWKDAQGREMSDHSKSVADHYKDIMEERKDNQCPPELQAGDNAGYCTICKRKTIHQYTNQCMVSVCDG